MSHDGTSPNLKVAVAKKLSNYVCIPDRTDLIMASRNHLPGTSLTLHEMFIVVGGACTVVTLILCIITFCSHLVWRMNIKEQRHMMRISILPIMFAVFSWLALLIYGLGYYLDPVPKAYEVVCVATFFNLMVQVISPDEATRKEFYVQADRLDRKHKTISDCGSWRWFETMQMLPYIAMLGIGIISVPEIASAAAECGTEAEDNKAQKVVLTVFTVIFTIMGLVAILKFYGRFKAEFQGTKTLRRFSTLKGFVALIIKQSLLINILQSTGAVTATEYMTMADFKYGVYSFIVTCESFIFACFAFWTFSAFWYTPSNVAKGKIGSDESFRNGPDAPVWRYLLAVIFPTDIFAGFAEAMKSLFTVPCGKRRFDYTAGTGRPWQEGQGGDISYQSVSQDTNV